MSIFGTLKALVILKSSLYRVFSDNHKYISILLYRRDSDIVAPYEKWQYYDTRIRQQEQDRNYAANKTKKVAWFVSNCGARNGRLQFAHELGKYIDVSFHFNGFLYRLLTFSFCIILIPRLISMEPVAITNVLVSMRTNASKC